MTFNHIYQSKDRRFEPCREHISLVELVWPSGKATGFDPVIQRFESYHPSQ